MEFVHDKNWVTPGVLGAPPANVSDEENALQLLVRNLPCRVHPTTTPETKRNLRRCRGCFFHGMPDVRCTRHPPIWYDRYFQTFEPDKRYDAIQRHLVVYFEYDTGSVIGRVAADGARATTSRAWGPPSSPCSPARGFATYRDRGC